jgi:glutamine amidotransferase
MKISEVTVIDYGVGNLLSVKRGLEKCGANVVITSSHREILASNKIVLPGVGAFPNAMFALNRLGLTEVILELAERKTDLLAICLGMQLLMNQSEEFTLTQGLGLIPGQVVAIPRITTSGIAQKIPHVGWNELEIINVSKDPKENVLSSFREGSSVYFVHSYMVELFDASNLQATTNLGGYSIPAVISKDNITACQFHPEKSGLAGLKILENFVSR